MTKSRRSGDRRQIRQKYFRRGDGALMIRDPDGRFRRVDSQPTRRDADTNGSTYARPIGESSGGP